ncbi:proline racemase family protein, partial [Brevibacillus agri]
IGIGEPFVHESIVGSLFTGTVLATAEEGCLQAVVTRIAGSAWLTGKHTIFYHPEDELAHGFLLIPAATDH